MNKRLYLGMVTTFVAVLLSTGTNIASASPVESKNESFASHSFVSPEQGAPATVAEVRSFVTVEEMVDQGQSLDQIHKYYPELTQAAFEKAKSRPPVIQPFITQIPCTNIDFYGVFRQADAREFCFANTGYVNVSLGGISKVCPGNNNGRVLYNRATDATYYWSIYRGPVIPRDTCWSFGGVVEVHAVQIS